MNAVITYYASTMGIKGGTLAHPIPKKLYIGFPSSS
jgi:hypothetical protein